MYGQRIIYASILFLLVQQAALGDPILLDDFSTNLTLGNVKFFALNPDGSINPTGSTSGSSTSTFWKRVQLAPGNMATGSDGSLASPAAGVLGGVRKVEIRNGTSSNQASNFKIFGGLMEVDSPSANMLCLACLMYEFTSAPQDFTIVSKIILDFANFDQSARNNVRLSVAMSDGTKTAYGVIDTSTATSGLNKFFLTGMTNWGQLNKSSIRSVKLDFTTTNPGVDFKLNAVSFTHAPEPNFVGVLTFAIGISGVAQIWKRRHLRRTEPRVAAMA